MDGIKSESINNQDMLVHIGAHCKMEDPNVDFEYDVPELVDVKYEFNDVKTEEKDASIVNECVNVKIEDEELIAKNEYAFAEDTIDIKFETDNKEQPDATDPLQLDLQTFECEHCSFVTKCRSSVGRHMQIHKDASEVEIFKCEMCSFQCRRKGGLTQHMVLHKDPSEMEMFRCKECTFVTRRKGSLRQHMIRHKDPSQIQLYHCPQCIYATPHRWGLKSHMLTHRPLQECTSCKSESCNCPSEKKGNPPVPEQPYKCDQCGFVTKRRDCYKNHLKMHRDPSEIKMFKCDVCGFQCKKQVGLRQHMMKHMDTSQLEMLHCYHCSYRSPHKGSLRRHMIIHRDPTRYATIKSEKTDTVPQTLPVAEGLVLLQCKLCSFVTKRRDSLKQHLLLHKDTSEVKMFRCEICGFESRRKAGLDLHMLRHKDPSEVELYRCTKCSYSSPRKNGLRSHMVSHGDPAVEGTFACGVCGFRSKNSRSLKTHHDRKHKGQFKDEK